MKTRHIKQTTLLCALFANTLLFLGFSQSVAPETAM